MNDTQDDGPCPFKIGDIVYFRPCAAAYSKLVMQGPDGCPEVGQAVKIAKIVQENYIVYEGHDGGGIWWSAFSPT